MTHGGMFSNRVQWTIFDSSDKYHHIFYDNYFTGVKLAEDILANAVWETTARQLALFQVASKIHFILAGYND
jgi:hypothetical protein